MKKVFKQIGEQILHMLAGATITFVCALPLWWLDQVVAAVVGAICSLGVCLFREMYLQLPIERPRDTFFWGLGTILMMVYVGLA